MKSSKQILTNDHPKTFSKREDKKSVSINWNSRLFFQVGLIVSLLAVFFLMESTFGLTVQREVARVDPFELNENENLNFEVEKAKVIPVKEKVRKLVVPKRPILTTIITVVPNTNITETELGTTEIEPNVIIVDTKPLIDIKTKKTHSVLGVEFAPVFPGCESLTKNNEKIDCMSTNIKLFIRSKFRTDNFSDLNSGTKHIIYVEFKIDKHGDVVDVKAIAQHQSLIKEASRVISKLPKMTPGKQGNTNVDVIYRVPIRFNID